MKNNKKLFFLAAISMALVTTTLAGCSSKETKNIEKSEQNTFATSTAPVTPTTVTATNSDNISVDYTDNGIVPSVINLQSGQKYTLTMTMNHDPRGCMSTILLQWLDDRVQPMQRGTTLTFNVDATTPGTYRFVCGSMGMSHGAQVIIQ